jgi:hypothetical protein
MNGDSHYRILATVLFCTLHVVYWLYLSPWDWLPVINLLAMAIIELNRSAEGVEFIVLPIAGYKFVTGLLTWWRSRGLR